MLREPVPLRLASALLQRDGRNQRDQETPHERLVVVTIRSHCGQHAGREEHRIIRRSYAAH
jgi:hypothetical protein